MLDVQYLYKHIAMKAVMYFRYSIYETQINWQTSQLLNYAEVILCI